MPFGGEDPAFAECRTTRAVLMLDYLAEFFAGGSSWWKGHYTGPEGSRCLVQAMSDIRRRERLKGDGARTYLLRAIREMTAFTRLMEFNDNCSDYEELERVLRRSRDLATAAGERGNETRAAK